MIFFTRFDRWASVFCLSPAGMARCQAGRTARGPSADQPAMAGGEGIMSSDATGNVSGQGDPAGRPSGPPTRTAPIWPGMEGGRYKPLSDRDVERVHAASLDLLEQVGLSGASDAWRDRVVAAGGRLAETGRLCFPRGLVEDCIARAERNFVVCGRDPK
ncbi:MAG: trimethylamine methyltransferase family protein, partial [Anaerolineae bacterium]